MAFDILSSNKTKSESRDEQITVGAGADSTGNIGARGNVVIPTNSGNLDGQGNLGIRAGKNAKVNLTFNSPAPDPEFLRSVLDQQTTTLSDILAGAQSASQGVNQQLSSGLGSILDKLTGLAESKQTSGESGRDQTILWIVVAAFAALAVIFWSRK